jgi:hypothetical protein
LRVHNGGILKVFQANNIVDLYSNPRNKKPYIIIKHNLIIVEAHHHLHAIMAEIESSQWWDFLRFFKFTWQF